MAIRGINDPFAPGGATHCAGSLSQIANESRTETVSMESTGMSKESPPKAPPEERKDTPQEASRKPAREVSREARPEAPSEAQKPVRPAIKGEAIAQRGDKVPEPPRPVPVPAAPPAVSAPPTPAPPPPEAPPAAGAPRPADPGRGSRFVLNFDNAGIYEIIRVMAEMMNINYLVDPRVKGVVSIRTSGQISQKDLFPVFQSILKMNGSAAVQKGPVYEIVPFGNAIKLFTRPGPESVSP